MGWLSAAALDIRKNLFFDYAVTMTGFSVSAVNGGWRMVIRGWQDGKQVVAFTSAERYEDLFDLTLYHAERQELVWKHDKYSRSGLQPPPAHSNPK